jgi:hypothetical protein
MVPWYLFTIRKLRQNITMVVRVDVYVPGMPYQWYLVRTTYIPPTYVRTTCVRTYGLTYHIMVRTHVKLSDWKRAHMCTENHVCFGRIHGSQLREGANVLTSCTHVLRTYWYSLVPWQYVRTMVLTIP